MSEKHNNVSAISAFNDNYIWAISSNINNNIALVDPGDAEVCIHYIEKHGLVLSDILITHHHADHVGGLAKLKEYAKKKAWNISIYGPTNDNIAGLDNLLKNNDRVNLENIDLTLSVVELPGHTHGHIAYYNDDMLFCGDTLFSGGCGRVFEGTHEQMYHSLEKLKNLNEKTKVYCAHEYTQANIAFALAVDPNNVKLQQYAQQVDDKRKLNQATIPSSIGLERQINPFLRCDDVAVKVSSLKELKPTTLSVETASEVEVFSALRTWKDNF